MSPCDCEFIITCNMIKHVYTDIWRKHFNLNNLYDLFDIIPISFLKEILFNT